MARGATAALAAATTLETCLESQSSKSSKAGHPKAGRSDFEISDSNPIQGKCGKCGRPSLPQENKGLRRKCGHENAENADTKTRKKRMTGFNVTGCRRPPWSVSSHKPIANELLHSKP